MNREINETVTDTSTYYIIRGKNNYIKYKPYYDIGGGECWGEYVEGSMEEASILRDDPSVQKLLVTLNKHHSLLGPFTVVKVEKTISFKLNNVAIKDCG